MKNVIQWLLFNTFLVLTLYVGIVLEIEGARRLGLFAVWFSAVVCLLVATAECKKKLKPRGYPAWLNVVVDTAIVGFLVWHGYVVTGAVCLLGLIVYEDAMKGVEGKEEIK
jgi:uncharacterized membrane protein YhaH (DUF805 family)